jgi:hypothetical protein
MPDHAHSHAEAHPPHATAEAPTLSLLRLSAGQRLAGAAAVLALVWVMTLAMAG